MSRERLLDGLAEASRLRRALRPLDAPVVDRGWNHEEVEDLLVPAVRLADASVLVGLVPRAGTTHVLLTRRTDNLRHHGGQVSFPGGRMEPSDPDAIAAALRETREEIGVLPAQVEPIGLLDPLVTITGFRVLPVVAVVDPRHEVRADPREVAEVFEVPLPFLLDPRNLDSMMLEYRGRQRRVLEYRYPAQRIWGATASILFNLRQRLEDMQ